MMRLLGSDSGARQSLFEMMDPKSLARLQCADRSWRDWIALAPFIGARTISIDSHQQEHPAQGAWLRRSVQHLQFKDDIVRGWRDRVLLLQWTRLRSITATVHHTLLSDGLMQEGFASVAATLQQLEMAFRGEQHLASVRRLLAAARSLHQLQSLSIRAWCDLTSLDLSPLLSLPRMQRLVLRGARSSLEEASYSLEQVDALSQCRALADLECGQWLPMRPLSVQPTVQLTDAQLKQIEDGVSRLIRLRNENGAAPLRRLSLGNEPMILPQCWRALSQFTSLEELDAHWSCQLSAANWILLARFPQLHTLRIRELECEFTAVLDLGLVLPSLAHCRTLHTFVLHGDFSMRAEHVSLLAQIPSLEFFHAICVKLESLAPLVNAPALTTLRLAYCDGLHWEPINISEMIPAMPLVHTLATDELVQWTPEQAQLLNAALHARLPKLVRFTHNGQDWL